MDTNGKDNFGQEKRNEDLFSYTSPNISSDWRFGEPNLTNTSIPTVNPIAVYKGAPMEASSSSSPPMIDSFCPTIWDHPTNTSNLGFSDINLQHIATNSNSLGIRRGPFGPLGVERNLDVGWAPPSSMVKGNVFLPSGPGLFSQSLSNFPADSGFIERAARFSCFGKGNFSDAMNSYGISESANPYERGTMVMQGTQDVLLGSELKSLSGEKSQRNELNAGEASKNACLSVEPSTNEGSPLKKSNSFVQSHDKAKQGGDVSGNESDEAEFSGGGGGGGEPSSSKAIGLKKRKRDDQDNELGKINEVSQPPSENSKDNMETQHKGDQTPVSTNKAGGKHGKQGSQASDSPKEEYIHVRARRGQATNSHSLAERVRREKISERMKFLQDLVPGCSKVTGKAVMLDEIINYVQSLQRQVEFLSMKLATVNPRLDFNLGGLLTKDILQPRAGPSSSLGYSPDMTMPFPPSYASQPGLVQSCLPGIANSSDALRRSITTQLTAMSEGYKQLPQVPNMWVEDELHNVVQMGLNSSAPLDNQDLNVSLSQGHMKVEL